VQLPATFEPVPWDCCFDYTGDGQPDDAFGTLLALAGTSGLGGDPTVTINTALENGDFVKVFDWRELAPDLVAGDVQLSIFEGRWTDATSHTDRIQGLGRTTFLRSSFGPFGAHDQLNDGEVVTGLVTATGNQVTLGLPLLFIGGDDLVEFHAYEPRLEAPVSYTARGRGTCTGLCTVDEEYDPPQVPGVVGGAKFGGVVVAVELLSHMDDFYRGCACAGVDPSEPVILWELDYNSFLLDIYCTDNYVDPGACDPEDPCFDLADVCAVIGILGNVFDVDLDNDLINESLSIGLRLGFAGTTLDPMSDEIFSDGFESGDTSAWSGGT
jgi:hypothetical protein